MKVLVIGSGGREYAIVRKLAQSPQVKELFALPGNGGIANYATCVPGNPTDIESIVEFAQKEKMDWVAVIPDDPLALGLVDALEAQGIKCFGPTQAAAQIESSKAYAKELMAKYQIPTAKYQVFTQIDQARTYLENQNFPIVIKADGLALGKGVIIAQDKAQAQTALHDLMENQVFGASGKTVVIEEYLTGPEVTVLAFTDGKTLVTFPSAMDHKRIGDGDQGLNTGGMGAISPNPYYTEEIAKTCAEQIFYPTLHALQAEGRPFKGCLYFGLMLCADGPKVIEYNARFGDPETQALLPLLQTDLFEIMVAIRQQRLAEIEVKFLDQASCCVCVAAQGYPVTYQKGQPVKIAPAIAQRVDIAGCARKNGQLVSNGGRVLSVTNTAPDLASAITASYADLEQIEFADAYYRHDIGARALTAIDQAIPTGQTNDLEEVGEMDSAMINKEIKTAPASSYSVYVEKKPEYRQEAAALKHDIEHFLGIEQISEVRVINRYDLDNIPADLVDTIKKQVLSEAQLDQVSPEISFNPQLDFVVRFLPGQFDQRAASIKECIKLLAPQVEAEVQTSKIYKLRGNLTGEQIAQIKNYLINPVESEEISYQPTAKFSQFSVSTPEDHSQLVDFLDHSTSELAKLSQELGLAMDLADLQLCQEYFRSEGRYPTLTELRVIDTYWSDHCRHTCFGTHLENIQIADPQIQTAFENYQRLRPKTGPVTLMDLATVATKILKSQGKLDNLDESDEVNACTVKIKVQIDGAEEDWLLLFKNETHNHPTEIEPFGGAATCIGGAIRDPLSGRAYVYGAMRVTGAADPTQPVSETLPGKLSQRQICLGAAAGYSSYGNQIGVATGIVSEHYHPNYVAKRLEVGAVIAAAPQNQVRREKPAPGDLIILLGGATGRDGLGGATGSSKSHTTQSITVCGAEVQKGNAPEERKLQRLFRNPQATRLIKKCNDFGAGGISVAIGELADGLAINLDLVRKKYAGLNGTELAISESQERMAVVIDPADREEFLALAVAENLQAQVVAEVTASPRLTMNYQGETIVDLSREFLNSNGAKKHAQVTVPQAENLPKFELNSTDFASALKETLADLNVCSQRGLIERFDATIGAGTVTLPFGGRQQLTPAQTMVQKISSPTADTITCSAMAYGFNPQITDQAPFHGAYLAVIESVTKLIAAGVSLETVYLSLQEYFKKPNTDPQRWGSPFAALLGAFQAQIDLQVAAIGGKDSMSGTFEHLDVPNTLVSFAVGTLPITQVVTGEFKAAGHYVYHWRPKLARQLPNATSLHRIYQTFTQLNREAKISAAFTPNYGGVAAAIYKMAIGNQLGFKYSALADLEQLFAYDYGSLIVTSEVDLASELEELAGEDFTWQLIGQVIAQPVLVYGTQKLSLAELSPVYEGRLASVYPTEVTDELGVGNLFRPEQTLVGLEVSAVEKTKIKYMQTPLGQAKPQVLIPVFPGTNCEYDSAKAVAAAGADPEIFVLNNLDERHIEQTIEDFSAAIARSQMVFLPGGFSGADEPDGSAKLIAAFFRNQQIKQAVTELLDSRGGLMLGICNGFQALIKLGLLPGGRIIDPIVTNPTLTYNTIARHQAKIVRTKVVNNHSPWLRNAQVGKVYQVPISHGEGRFIAGEESLNDLVTNGQIVTQYVDEQGNPTLEITHNPNGSMLAIEGICSPDGRVLGKMGHSERIGHGLYQNLPGAYDLGLFTSAVQYFQGE